MTPEAQRIAIAESCGWKHVLRDPLYLRGRPPDWDCGLDIVPDFLNDLNAIADAVDYKIRENTDFSLLKYGDYMIKKHGTHGAITASAKQHCEAFLHTINKL